MVHAAKIPYSPTTRNLIYKHNGHRLPPAPTSVLLHTVQHILASAAERARAHSLPAELSLADHMRQIQWAERSDNPIVKKYAPSMIGYAQGYIAAKVEETSLRWYGQEDEFEGEHVYLKGGGYGSLIKHLKEELENKAGSTQGSTKPPKFELVLNQEVVKVIDQTSNVSIRTRQGKEMTADNVIFTMPLGVLKSLPKTFFEPALEGDRKSNAIRRLAFGTLDKFIISFKERFWPDDTDWLVLLPHPDKIAKQDMGGKDEVIHDREEDANVASKSQETSDPWAQLDSEAISLLSLDYSQTQSLNNNSKDSYPAHLIWYTHTYASHPFYTQPESAVHAYLINRLKPIFQQRKSISASTETDSANESSDANQSNEELPDHIIYKSSWLTDPYARGSYTSIPTPIKQDQLTTPSNQHNETTNTQLLDPTELECTPMDLDELARPVWDGRVRFAGEHTSFKRFASVHGSWFSGKDVATECITGLGY